MEEKFKQTFMANALNWRKLSYAKRKQVGAVLASEDGRELVSGYNGTISGHDNVCEEITDIACSECDHNTTDHKNCSNCDNGKVLRTKNTVLHAEENIICYAAKRGIPTNNTVMFITTSPCIICARLILQSGIKEVYYLEEYRSLDGVNFLKEFIPCEKLELSDINCE